MSRSFPSEPAGRVRLLRVNNVAKRLGLSDRTVRHYAETGALPAYRRGLRILLFIESDVEAFRVRRPRNTEVT